MGVEVVVYFLPLNKKAAVAEVVEVVELSLEVGAEEAELVAVWFR